MKKIIVINLLSLVLLSCNANKEYYVKHVSFPVEAGLEQKVDMAARLVPTPQQLEWQKMELTAFLHFGINTFTGREWGDGSEDPKLFNPTEFDAEQWIKSLKNAGFKMAIITAKHHDGFCLWTTKTTEHSVASSEWMNGKGDVVKAVKEACDKYGLRFGIYLSPWDRNAKSYGTPEYNEFFVAQLSELLTNYGNIYEVWLDGANGEGPNGKKQEYDWSLIISTIRRLQPKAVIAIMGDDVRWVGNESGLGRETEWSATVCKPASYPDKSANESLNINGMSQDLGSRQLLEKATDLFWYPSEVDVSIRPGWFYHAEEDSKVRSLSNLVDIYFQSVGYNSVLLLNIPPDKRGLIHENDVERISELSKYLKSVFAKNYVVGGEKLWQAGSGKTKEYNLEENATFNTLLLQEDISKGQRVEKFKIEILENEQWKELANGTTIGYKRMFRIDKAKGEKIRIIVEQSRNTANIINVAAFYAPDLSSHSFEIKDGNFMYDNKPVRIISGEMHYPRIPHQYWRHRMQMMKAMGLNAVATYVFWNIHEPEPGVWDFTGDKNLAEFIKIAGEEGLMVILRPGPYVCAEWDFGGYPWWLQNIDGMELRRDNEQFLKYTQLYINRLYQEIGNLQITKGGPIIMVQAENEFGSYVSQRKDIPLEEHRAYNAKIVQQLKNAGFDVPMFTSDGSWLFEGGATRGALPAANGESNIENLKKVVNEYNGGQGPYMVAEFYPGWLAHWVEPHPQVSAASIARQTEKYLQNDVSINYYMVHGGTNFGFTGGANYDNNHDIQPDLTSYDYDAPISEAGWVTPKFDSIRSVIKKYVNYELPEVPAAIPLIEIPPVKLDKVAMLEGLEHKVVENDKPMTFEQLNQGYGYVLYRKHFNQPISGTLEVKGLRDYATVYVNDEKIGELNRYFKKYTIDVDIPFNSTLEILVENMGRINYGSEIIHNTKGIISPVKINDMEIAGGWQMIRIPMDKAPDFSKMNEADVYNNNESTAKSLIGKPVLYKGTFSLSKIGDTFIDMENWGKGIIFINGKNIGRYWHVGPQQTLYIPGVWLNKGENEIIIFEQLNDKPQTEVKTTKVPVLTRLKLN